MRELNSLIAKIRSTNYKSIKSIYEDYDVEGNVRITPEVITNLINRSHNFQDRVIILTAIIDDINDVTKEIREAIISNKETLNFILRVTLLDNKDLEVVEESEDGWHTYTIEGTKVENKIVRLYNKALTEFESLN